MTPRERVVKVLLKILAHPYRFTRRELADHFGFSKDAIDEDIQALKNVGLHLEQPAEKNYRCAILPEKEFKELSYLQSLTEQERSRIGTLLNQYLPNREALYLNNKLASLYDFQQLGLRALRRPALDRIDMLQSAQNQKLQVILVNYRSNSNTIRDRHVEPFHIDPELDTLQAFALDSGDSKHFKLGRIERVLITDRPWQFEHQHMTKYTDVFRIADNNQEMVHLRLDVYAYNALIEAYPKALSETFPAAAPNTFDFQSKVNGQFIGLINFIMGNAAHVKIMGPQALKEKIKMEAKKILEEI